MRIALLTDADAFAGTERHIHDLDASLRAIGVEASVCCPAGSPLARAVTASGGRVIAVEKGGGVDVPAIRAMAGLLRRGEADVIHAHNGRASLIAAAAKRLAGRGRAVLTQHFLAPAHVGRGGLRGRASHLVHGWVDRNLDHVIAISDAVRQGVLDRGEATAARVTTIHNGIRAPRPRVDAGHVRASIGVTDDGLLVLCAARLESEKRVDVLIDAWRSVAAAHPSAVCVVAGVGGQRDALQRQIDAAGLGDRFRLLGFRDDVIDLMGACDLFVLPSDAEPFGLALVEAMALGRCVIATDAGGPREIVEDRVSGLLAAPGDAASLAAAIDPVLADAAMRARLGAAAMRRFSDRFRCERMAREVAALYARVAGIEMAGVAAADERPSGAAPIVT